MYADNGFLVLVTNGLDFNVPTTQELPISYGNAPKKSNKPFIKIRIGCLYDDLDGKIFAVRFNKVKSKEMAVTKSQISYGCETIGDHRLWSL